MFECEFQFKLTQQQHVFPVGHEPEHVILQVLSQLTDFHQLNCVCLLVGAGQVGRH